MKTLVTLNLYVVLGEAGRGKKNLPSLLKAGSGLREANGLLDGVADVHGHREGQLSGLDRDSRSFCRHGTPPALAVKEGLAVKETNRLDIPQRDTGCFGQ